MASTDDLRLLSLIESSDAGDSVFSSFSAYLEPFSALSISRKKQDRASTVRALAKQFLPFLNKSISLLPKRLSVAKSDKEARESASDLFRAYELCLDCIESVSALLACKPHTVQSERLQMIYCLNAWGFYEKVYTEAFKVLENLKGSDSTSRKSRLLPEVQDGEAELGLVVVDAVRLIFRAVAMSQKLDDKLHCLVQCFCELTVKEHYEAALSKDQIYKFARELLSALFGLKDRRMSVTIDISMSVLRSLTCQFEVESNENSMEFIDLVAYCTQKFRAAGDMYSAKVSKKLDEMADIFSEVVYSPRHVNLPQLIQEVSWFMS